MHHTVYNANIIRKLPQWFTRKISNFILKCVSIASLPPVMLSSERHRLWSFVSLLLPSTRPWFSSLPLSIRNLLILSIAPASSSPPISCTRTNQGVPLNWIQSNRRETTMGDDSWGESALNPFSDGVKGFVCGLCFPPCYMAQIRSDFDDSDCFFNFCCLNGPMLRSMIRTGYGIEGSCLGDMFCGTCGPCALCQMANEVNERGPISK